jgi:hypothetical protein
MASNVVPFRTIDGTVGPGTKLKTNSILAGARKAGLVECTVIGTQPDGNFYITSTEGHAEVIMAMRFAEFWLFSNALADCE